jgi:GT2 family glycosyltransferase
LTGPGRGVSVIVPTLDAVRAERITRSLAAQTLAHQAIVVDNGSPDRLQPAALRAVHPAVEVMRLERNEGYSRAVNLAAGRADGQILVLVNYDCALDETFLAELVEVLDGRADSRADRYGWDRDRLDPARLRLSQR